MRTTRPRRDGNFSTVSPAGVVLDRNLDDGRRVCGRERQRADDREPVLHWRPDQLARDLRHRRRVGQQRQLRPRQRPRQARGEPQRHRPEDRRQLRRHRQHRSASDHRRHPAAPERQRRLQLLAGHLQVHVADVGDRHELPDHRHAARGDDQAARIRAVLDNGTTTPSTTSDIKFVATGQCLGSEDFPYIYDRSPDRDLDQHGRRRHVHLHAATTPTITRQRRLRGDPLARPAAQRRRDDRPSRPPVPTTATTPRRPST